MATTKETITVVAACVIALFTAVGTTGIGIQYFVAQAEEVKDVWRQVHLMTQNYGSLRSDMVSLRVDMDSLRTDVALLRSDVELLRTDVDSLTANIDSLTDSNDQILGLLNRLCVFNGNQQGCIDLSK